MSETYPCKVCGETFFKACRLKNQRKTHSGEKPYPCTVCQKHIPLKYVVRHFPKACRCKNQQTTISGEKPYPCTVCHRQISVKNVERHFLKHVGLGINKRLIHESL